MINTYYNWMTYNPNEVLWRDYLPMIIFLYLACVVAVYMLCSIATQRIVSLKNTIFSIVFSPYVMFVWTWSLCFADESILKLLLPVYPLIILVVMRKMYKKYGNKKYEV